MLFVGIYGHRFGIDTLFMESDEIPNEGDFIRTYPEINFELDEREEEYLEIYAVSDIRVRQRV